MLMVAHDLQKREEWRSGVETRMYVSAQNGSSQLCIFEQWIASSMGAPAHWHPVEEVLTVVAGEAEIWIDENRLILTEGQSLIIPPRKRHGFRNAATGILRIRAVLASPFFEATFDTVPEPIKRWLEGVDAA
jgi:quercetin dioxygenase-like cupin family protein